MQFSAFSYRFMTFERDVSARKHYLIRSDAVPENSNVRKLQGTKFCSTNLAGDIGRRKMIAELLSHSKRQFYPSEKRLLILP